MKGDIITNTEEIVKSQKNSINNYPNNFEKLVKGAITQKQFR